MIDGQPTQLATLNDDFLSKINLSLGGVILAVLRIWFESPIHIHEFPKSLSVQFCLITITFLLYTVGSPFEKGNEFCHATDQIVNMSRQHSSPLSSSKERYARGSAGSGYEKLPAIGRVSTLVGRFEKNNEITRNESQMLKRRSLNQTPRVSGSTRNSVPPYQMYTNPTLLANS